MVWKILGWILIGEDKMTWWQTMFMWIGILGVVLGILMFVWGCFRMRSYFDKRLHDPFKPGGDTRERLSE